MLLGTRKSSASGDTETTCMVGAIKPIAVCMVHFFDPWDVLPLPYTFYHCLAET